MVTAFSFNIATCGGSTSSILTQQGMRRWLLSTSDFSFYTYYTRGFAKFKKGHLVRGSLMLTVVMVTAVVVPVPSPGELGMRL